MYRSDGNIQLKACLPEKNEQNRTLDLKIPKCSVCMIS